MSSDNGDLSGIDQKKMQRVILTLHKDTLQLEIAGQCDTLTDVLMILEKARLEIDARYRFIRARELMQEQVADANVEALTRGVTRGGLKLA